MENIEITTSEVETAAVNTAEVEEATESSEQGFDLAKAGLIALAIGATLVAAEKLGKVVYKKVKPMITASRIKKLEKEGYVVYYKANDDEPVEESYDAEESEDESIENE